MFKNFPQSQFQIVASDGVIRSSASGIFGNDKIVIPDAKVVVRIGDEIRRKIPNGDEEAFEVIDPVYFAGHRNIPAHFQVKVKRKGTFSPGTGGNFTFNLSGSNSRVNISSNDSSQNIVGNNNVFGNLRTSIKSGVSDETARAHLLSLVDKMEAAKDSKSSFATAYQAFITSAANHMAVIAPFLPALTKFVA